MEFLLPVLLSRLQDPPHDRPRHLGFLDLNEDLVQPSESFRDFIVFSQTLQEEEEIGWVEGCVRYIGRNRIIAFHLD